MTVEKHMNLQETDRQDLHNTPPFRRGAAVWAQAPRAPGVALYEQGKFPEAIVRLKHRSKHQNLNRRFHMELLGAAYYATSDIRRVERL